jgi:hypothetical protein
MLSRRKLLLQGGTAAVGGALVLSGCTAAQETQETQAQTDWANFLAQVQNIVAQGCSVVQGFIPTIDTITAVVTALYPSIGAAIAAGVAAVQSVATTICGAITPSTNLAKLRGARRGATAPVYIGTVTAGGHSVPVNGWGR